jgi:Na+/melibiose symporter-like transporter
MSLQHFGQEMRPYAVIIMLPVMLFCMLIFFEKDLVVLKNLLYLCNAAYKKEVK